MSFSQLHSSSIDDLRKPAQRANELRKPAQNQVPQTPPLLRSDPQTSPTPPLRPANRRNYRRNVFLNLPIAGRLTLGFLLAALVAALAAGAVGLQREQALSRQADFYHTLLQFNTSLTNGRSFLELMNSEAQKTLSDASVPNPSRETLASDSSALNNLANRYNQILTTYVENDLFDRHPAQLALLAEAGEDNLASQQRALASSALRTWQFDQDAQQAFLNAISHSNPKAAQNELQQQGQPTNSDALSALQGLIQFNDRLASAVDAATAVESHNQVVTTLLATACAFLVIALIGWLISETLVRRLRHLHRVTRAVEEGRINERVLVAGRDEIADVSLSVNAMVDTIVGLLEETRRQRDALSGAAEHLFSDMRIVNAGDLRVSAPVGNDPIGVLANAFNFTVGRFRRFMLRTQTTIEQLEVVSRQGLEHSNTFLALVRSQLRNRPSSMSGDVSAKNAPTSGPLRKTVSLSSTPEQENSLVRQIQRTQDTLLQTTREDLNKRLNTARETVEKAGLSIGRLSELISSRSGTHSTTLTEKMLQTQLQELVVLEQLLSRLTWEVRQAQFNSANNFTQIDTAFTTLARSASERPEPPASQAADGGSSASDARYQELLRHAGSFAFEIHALSKRLTVIIQEMRASITPFRLEGIASMGESAQTATDQPSTISETTVNTNLLSTW